jgi:hypothetical protein
VSLTGTWPGRCARARATNHHIPNGLAGVIRTLRMMVDVTGAFKTDLTVRTTAVCLVAGRSMQLADGRCVQYPAVKPKDWLGELGTLHAFVRDYVRYVRDVEGVETLQTPVQTLAVLSGDCDDKAMLLNALAASIGFETRFAAIGVRGGDFSHVMAQGRLGDTYCNMETILTDPIVGLGWEPPDATQVMWAHCQ